MSKEIFYRSIEIKSGDVDEDSRTVSLSFSSEDPYQRHFGYEILDHSEKSVNLSRLNNSGPLLMDHDMTQQVGVVERAEIGNDKKGRAVVRFSRSQKGQEIFQDVIDGIRKNVSVEYQVNRMDEVEDDEEIKSYRVTDWSPMEVSLVSIPADTTVGVGRSEENIEEVEICQTTINMKL